MALLLMGSELYYYGYLHGRGWLRFPEQLPLQLSTITLWITVFALFTLSSWCFDLAYYYGLTGAWLSMVTPDLWAPVLSVATIQFFIDHGGVVVAVLFLVLAGEAKPSRKGIWRAFLALNVITLLVGLFDALYGTNYMFLREKPSHRTLLDFLGPWPLYILCADAMALVLFWLLHLPFHGKRRAAAPADQVRGSARLEYSQTR